MSRVEGQERSNALASDGYIVEMGADNLHEAVEHSLTVD
jgi:hypothetical protein